ncbi:uncharacterized protein MONOS_8086 [Monocercomonoides exilis]|uniref:uncharacterized protein n=1 Tax=Monocercomonoides exilis TaxID=2049356 RepID=UPI0035593D1E|nr:hypothetical protein MONOS_8086 [Monocercomonoides exilis]|eukprot:MONOS_8086.1-p1 / transcript=MONOS_8086.1 / gene=MONOS_8086 / organism=Monocercomonoides_exilis_PA203 / gene_product=unspecified product / transcript_product=unspecified product / location=Mono_scaffold00295:40522-41610(-) / protein_length=363 / sequence_SO=supercontig / SO=protein_coding / is_pseudo=false
MLNLVDRNSLSPSSSYSSYTSPSRSFSTSYESTSSICSTRSCVELPWEEAAEYSESDEECVRQERHVRKMEKRITIRQQKIAERDRKQELKRRLRRKLRKEQMLHLKWMQHVSQLCEINDNIRAKMKIKEERRKPISREAKAEEKKAIDRLKRQKEEMQKKHTSIEKQRSKLIDQIVELRKRINKLSLSTSPKKEPDEKKMMKVEQKVFQKSRSCEEGMDREMDEEQTKSDLAKNDKKKQSTIQPIGTINFIPLATIASILEAEKKEEKVAEAENDSKNDETKTDEKSKDELEENKEENKLKEKELTKQTEEEKGNEESSILSKGDQLPSQQTQKEPEEEQKLTKADEASVEEATCKTSAAS